MNGRIPYPPCLSGCYSVVDLYKHRWPELVGKNQTEAIKVIERENPFVTVRLLPKDSYTTMDYCCNRVNLWVDKGIVLAVPKVKPFDCYNPPTIRMSGWKPYPPCMDAGCMDAECCGFGSKYSWPELVGKPQKEATEVIKRENPYVGVVPIPIDAYTIMNFCCNRVWLKIDNGVVYSTPTIG